MRLAQYSLRDRIGAQLDSLDRNFRRMVAVAEHLPEISDRVLEELNEQATQLLWTMDVSVDNAFSGFDRQRMELQSYVSREREALVEQLRTTGEDLLSTAFDAVPGLVGRVLLYVVLALAVLLGGPFALGFWLGGVRQRAKLRKHPEAGCGRMFAQPARRFSAARPMRSWPPCPPDGRSAGAGPSGRRPRATEEPLRRCGVRGTECRRCRKGSGRSGSHPV